jgi:hypothetical protein
VAIVVAVLLAAFLVSRSCGSSKGDVSKDEALEIARQNIDFTPSGVQIKNVPGGLGSQRIWAVSLYTGTFQNIDRCIVLQIDSDSGDVLRRNAC